MADAATFALQRNLVVQAGAGTGKTHSLITLCLHALGGIGRAEPLHPSRLWAVTFTEKAAAELKGRLRQRIDGLAGGGEEADLLAACAALGVPLPDRDLWSRVRRDQGQAQLGTIHALCGQILRRHPGAAGLDARAEPLDELAARRLLSLSCEETVVRALSGALGDALEQSARRLCADLRLRGSGQFGLGLVDEIATLLASLGESGRSPQDIVSATPGLDPSKAGAARAEAAARIESAARAMQAEAATAKGRAAEVAGQIAAMLRERVLGRLGRGDAAGAWQALREARERAAGVRSDSVRGFRMAVEEWLNADAGVRSCELARDLAGLASAALAGYRAAKARAGAVDFDDLTRLCRDLLARHPAILRSERERLGVLLVDEFQDTSRTQLELFALLTGTGTRADPRHPGSLVVVGDRKQSIYEFRGADVASAQGFAEGLLSDGAGRQVLRESRRSRPALVRFTNLLFSRALGAGEHPFETPFSPDDALTAFRPEGRAGPCAELIEIAAAGPDAEAEAVAARIAALLAPDAPEKVHEAGEEGRRVRGGDVAVLLRRFTNLESFRRALLRRRIPHVVYKGHGFHASREVVDLVALLSAAVDPADALALAAVLRSPFGPVSDGGLALLSRGPRPDGDAGHGLPARGLADAASVVLEPEDAEAARRVLTLVSDLRAHADRLGPAALLEVALESADYAASAAAGLYGEQAVANVDKLLGMARAAELRGTSVRRFLGSLRELAGEEAREADAPVVEDKDPHAVRLLTVHAAKGLEFPVVFVPECGVASVPPFPGRTLLDPDLGFAIRAAGLDGERRWGPHGDAVLARRRQRELAQSRRLLYVAVTRARDLVVLSGRPARNGECWRRSIDAVASEASTAGLLRISLADAPAAPRAPTTAPLSPEQVLTGDLPPFAEADALLQTVLAPPRGSAPSLSLPVIQLADAVGCPRRYHLLHELRLEERPDRDPELPDPLAPESEQRATALGTLAHRLLELLPLALGPRERRTELERLLRLEGEEPARHGEVLDAACAFLESELGARMSRAGARLQREVPFVVRIAAAGAPEVLVRGRIDALLLEERSATVLDYKLSHARDPERYAAQLDLYALAAEELVQGALPVRTGIVFLRSPGAPVAECAPAPAAAVRERAATAAREIDEGRRTGAFRKAPVDRCRAMGCGFVASCHPGQ